MKNEQSFKGKIFLTENYANKVFQFEYQTSPIKVKFENSIMNAFVHFNFSNDDKKILSRQKRSKLCAYLNVNLFELNSNANQLAEVINNFPSNSLYIEAYDYGAFITLATIFSGKIKSNKKIEVNLKKSPLALFPKSLVKKIPSDNIQFVYNHQEDFWINQVKSLYSNDYLNKSFKKSA